MIRLTKILLSGMLFLSEISLFAQGNYGNCLGNSCDAGIIAINILPLNAGFTTPPYHPDSLPEGDSVILSFNLKNYGDSVYYKPGVDYIRFGVTIANDYQDMMVMFNSMNDGYDYLFPNELLFTTPNFTIVLPNYKSFDICIKSLIPNDINSSNDGLCKTFKTKGGTGIPNNINESQHDIINYIYYRNEHLYIHLSNKQNTNQVYVTITNSIGQLIDNRKINTNDYKGNREVIPLHSLSKGIYFISMYSETELIDNKKFIVN